MPKGALRINDLKQVQITGRAPVYGYARMNIDGHFPLWGVADAERTAEGIIDLFSDGIARRPQRGRGGRDLPNAHCHRGKFIACS